MRIPVYAATLLRARSLSPRMRRVTLGGGGLAGFESTDLPDERIKLLLPQPGQARPVLPEIEGGEFRYPPRARRPISRTFTVRRFDPELVELEIDIALHDGPAAAWSQRAEPGVVVGVAGPTGGYQPALRPGRHLLVGDEAALPAIATIVERLPAEAHADALVEISDPNTRLAIESRAEVSWHWLDRPANGAPPGARLVQAVRDHASSLETAQVWAAGEAIAMRAIRRFIRDELELPRERFQVVGYWRHELSEDEAIDAHLAAVEAARAAGGGEIEVEDAGLY
jgi:NADPH-dependent ferric siderophore reductase